MFVTELCIFARSAMIEIQNELLACKDNTVAVKIETTATTTTSPHRVSLPFHVVVEMRVLILNRLELHIIKMVPLQTVNNSMLAVGANQIHLQRRLDMPLMSHQDLATFYKTQMESKASEDGSN